MCIKKYKNMKLCNNMKIHMIYIKITTAKNNTI